MLLHFYLELLQSSSGICSSPRLLHTESVPNMWHQKQQMLPKISWWILPLSHQRILTISLILLLLTVYMNYYYSSAFVDFHLIFLKIILSFSTYLKTEKKHNFIFTFLWTRPQRNFRRGDNPVFRQCRFSKFGINPIKIYCNESLSKRSQF